MRKVTIVLSILIALAFTAQTFSQTPVRESFEYPVGTVIDTLVGSPDAPGWGGSWDHFYSEANTNDSAMVSDTSFAYENLWVEGVPRVGNHVVGTNTTAWAGQRWGRHLAETWPDEAGNTYWISFLIQLTEFTNNGWAGLGLWNDTTECVLLGHEWGNPNWSLGQYTEESRAEISWDEGPQWLVIKMIMSGDTTSEQSYLWCSPDPAGGEPDTAMADASIGVGALNDGFNRLVFHFGGEGVGMQMMVDEIRLGTTWEDVSSEISTDVAEEPRIPPSLTLAQNYPNPFNPTTTIRFHLREQAHSTLSVYNARGELVETLVDGVMNAGTHEVLFHGQSLPSGVYFYQFLAGQTIRMKKMVLMK